MLVYGSAADIAATRKRYFCFFIAGKQCSDKIVGRTDTADALAVHYQIVYPGRINRHSVTVFSFNHNADALHSFQ